MLNEEAAHLNASATALSAPGAPTVTVRSPNSGENGMTGVTTNIAVKITANTFFGETAAGTTSGAITAANGQVADVQITPVAGAQWYNVYVNTNGGTFFLAASKVGGQFYTIQGALPSSVSPPGADTGTGGTNREEGLIGVLSGHSAPSPYPTNWQAGYFNNTVGDTLRTSVLNTAFQKLWDGTGAGMSTYGAYRADPAEIIGEGGDIMRLSNDIVQEGTATNYRLFVEQSEVPGVRVGAAVSEFQNPVTRSVVRVVVHPWLNQGNVLLMSYTMPFAWSNVSNIVEFVAVQDYLSVSWPVIDASFRFSMFMLGALVVNAPFYCGLLQGIQQSDRSGSVGTWS